MNLARLPLLERLEGCSRVLLSGAGGGYDIFTGLPLYFYLRDRGIEVFLGNMSFSDLTEIRGRTLTPYVREVNASSNGARYYFPEKYLCEWLEQQGEPASIQCFVQAGVAPLADAYRAVVKEYDVEAVVLVDGGTDSLMRGDEVGLGTPQEDIASIAAVDQLDVREKLLVCLGFGIDAFHGVCHAQFLEGVADLSARGGFLGAFTLLKDMPEVQRYMAASDYVLEAMKHHQSIVTTSIISALEGRYGNYHRTDRTAGSTLWINPLMTMYWGFDLEAVARRCLYLDQIRESRTYRELCIGIDRFRASLPKRKGWEPIPV